MIIVTGATGQLGRAIVESLLKRIGTERVGAEGIGVSVRDPEKAADFARRGVRVRRGDYEDADSLQHAFRGATQILLVSSNAAASGGDPLAQHRTAIEAARAVGARRIVYTSQIAASDTSAFAPARDHAATETMLAGSGLAWTALRHGFYAESAMMFLGEGLQAGVVAAPADGKVNWTTHADLAEADARVLLDEGRFDGTITLAASASLDFADLAAIASEVKGSHVQRDIITESELREKMARRGMPPGAVNIALGFYVASKAGEFATADTTLETLLGRAAVPMRDVIARRVSGAAG